MVCPFQRATRASPWAMSSISTSSGEGSSRSSRRPDSMRCQARGAADALAAITVGADRRRLMAVAAHQMIVDHAHGLHEGIDDGRPAEAEAPRASNPWRSSRRAGSRRALPDGCGTCSVAACRPRSPTDSGEAFLLLNGETGVRVACTLASIFARLRTMPSSFISLASSAPVISRDDCRVEAVESPAKCSRLRRMVIQESPA